MLSTSVSHKISLTFEIKSKLNLKSFKENNMKIESSSVSDRGNNASCTAKHPLRNQWTLWYLDNDRNKSWEEKQNEISTFDTVEDFWNLYNMIKYASELQPGNDYSLFKQNIRPMWEDAANANGGRWILSMHTQQELNNLDDLWLNVVCMSLRCFLVINNYRFV